MSDDLVEKCTKVVDDYRKQVSDIYDAVIGKVIVKKADRSQGCYCSFVIKENSDTLDKPIDPLDRRVHLEHYSLCDFCKNLQKKGTTLRDIISALASGMAEISTIDTIKAGDKDGD